MNKWIAFISFVTLMTVASVQASLSTMNVSGQMGYDPPTGFSWTSDWEGRSEASVWQGIPDPWVPDYDVDLEVGDASTSATANLGANNAYAQTNVDGMKSEAYVEPPPGYASQIQSDTYLLREFTLSEGGTVKFSFDIELSGESFTGALGDYAEALGIASLYVGKLTVVGGIDDFKVLYDDVYNIDWSVADGAVYGPWSYTGTLMVELTSTELGGDTGFVKFGTYSEAIANTVVPTPSAVVLCIVGLSSVGWLPKRRIF